MTNATMNTGVHETSRPVRRYERLTAWCLRLLPLALILGLYLGMATYRLGGQDPDKDELTTSAILRLPTAARLISNRLCVGHAPLYFATAYHWVRLTRHTYPAMIWLSVLIGMGTLPLMVLLAREAGLKTGWAWGAGLLMSVHPTFIHFTRYIRPWSGVILITTAILWLSLRQLRRPGRGTAAVLFLTGVIGAVWNHSLLILWVTIIVAILPQRSLRERARAGFWLAATGAVIAHAVQIAICMAMAGGTKPVAWISLKLRDYLETGLYFFSGRGSSLFRPDWPWLLALISIAVLIAAVWMDFAPRRRDRDSDVAEADLDATARWRVLTLTILLPWSFMILLSLTFRPLLVYRYMVIMLPALVLLMVRMAAWLTERGFNRRVLAVGFAGLILLMGWDTGRQMRERANGLQKCVRRLEKKYQPTGQDTVLVFSQSAEESLRLFSRRGYHRVLIRHSLPQPEVARMFAVKTKGYNRLWVLNTHPDDWNVMRTADWPKWTGRQFYHCHIETARLFGYILPKAANLTEARSPKADVKR